MCAPAGAVDERQVREGVAVLESLGLRVRVGAAVARRHRFTAGTAEERLRDLASLWDDAQVAAVMCARGGAGASWLLDRLDFESMAAHPKVFLGYSDLTFVHAALNARGLVTFHGPMVATDFAGRRHDEKSLRAALFGEGAPYVSGPGDLAPLRAGVGEGRLLGGCLSILASAAGTPWAFRPDPEGTILFLEDLDERPYRIDRMIFQLRAAGAFEGVRGVVFGEMKGCDAPQAVDYGLQDVLVDALSGLDVPVAFGLSSGHTRRPNVTLPFGVRARLSCDGTARLEVLEASVT